MLPNMSDVLTEWTQSVKLKTVTKTTVDFSERVTVTTETKRAVVQVAEKEKLNIDSLDWSKEYMWFHTVSDFDVGQFIEYKGKDYKIIGRENYSDYGYYAVVGEETKKALLV